MRPKTVLMFCATLAGVAAAAAVLSEINDENGATSPFRVMISRFVVVMAFATFGIYAARDSRLRGSVIVTSESPWSTFQDLVNWGVLPGAVLGLVNYLFFFTYRYSPIVTPRIRDMDGVYDTFLISLDAALTEEVIYRLFVVSALLFLFEHLYRKIKHVWPSLVSLVPRAMALALSSLAFAIVHDLYGFTAAFLAGIILGFIYLSSGVESAIAAHFVANFLFFSASYLS